MYRIQMTTSTSSTPNLWIGLRSVRHVHYTQQVTSCNAVRAFLKLADQLPSLESIKNDPDNATVPTSQAATCMVVFKALSALERDWADAWMKYVNRLDKEAQGLFANGVRSSKYNKTKQSMIMQNKLFTQWAMDNNYMFAADKV